MTSQPIVPCPYRSLSAFREEHAPFFFGREAFTEKLVSATQQCSLVAVIGASGSGKSSVVFAGLIPHLRQQGNWQIASFSPGRRPLYALADAMISVLKPQESEIDWMVRARKLATELQQNPKVLRHVVTAITENNTNRRLLLVADQFEELYTLCSDFQERAHFLESLLEAVHHAPNFTLVLTLRADFLENALSYRPFADALQYGVLMLPSMNHQELRDAIQKPAQMMNVQIESGLAERILDDVAGEPGILPLLEFTLTQLWTKQRNGLLTLMDYVQIGGVGLSLAKYAEEVYAQLSSADQQQVQRVFLQLVRPGEGTEDTRRQATLAEVGQYNEDVIERLTAARLLIVTQGWITGERTVEIAHEALIREWQRLRHWIEIDRSFLIWQERLRALVHQWLASGKDDGALLRGIPLAEAEDWLQQGRDFSEVERDFIQQSLALRKQEQRRQQQSQLEQWLSVAAAIVGLVTSVLSVLLSLSSAALPLYGILVFIVITAVLLITYFVVPKLYLSIRNSLSRNVLINNQDTNQLEQVIAQNARQLERCADVVTISTVYQRLTHSQMESPANLLIRTFGNISENVEVALNQGTAYHQRLALKSIRDKLDVELQALISSSYKYPVLFRPIAHSWRAIITNYVEQLAKTTELRQEIDSPYITGVPLTEQQEIFTGRTDIGTRIEQLLLDRRRPPLLLYGQRRMGKTSLLNNLGRLLPNTIIPMFVDLQGAPSSASDHAGFLYNLAKGMVNSAKRQSALTLPSLTREALPTDPFTSFNEWLDDVEHALGQNTALLALDEFEVLDSAITKGRFDEQDVLGMLRHLIQHRPRFKVLLAGSHTIEEYQRWASYLINVQVVHISYLKEDEARQLIEYPVKDFTLRYEPDAVKRVLQLTRCHPFLVQLLCGEIVALKNEQDPSVRRLATMADVEAAVPEALSSGSFFFADIQNNQVDAAGLVILRLLAAQGEGAIVSRSTTLQQLPDVSESAFELLLQRELIEEVGEGFRFQVELIRCWFAQ